MVTENLIFSIYLFHFAVRKGDRWDGNLLPDLVYCLVLIHRKQGGTIISLKQTKLSVYDRQVCPDAGMAGPEWCFVSKHTVYVQQKFEERFHIGRHNLSAFGIQLRQLIIKLVFELMLNVYETFWGKVSFDLRLCAVSRKLFIPLTTI